MQNAIAEQDKKISELKKQFEDAKTPKEKGKIVQEIIEEDEKLSEKNSNITKKNYSIAIYSTFDEFKKDLNFTPLYMVKKTGFSIIAMLSIGEHIAEVRYGRRWEPEVLLHVRTHKRTKDEQIMDISGFNNVKWRVDMSSGTTVYISKIDEKKSVAAWTVNDYTFSAYGENLSFEAFHAIVADELVDLSTHYY